MFERYEESAQAAITACRFEALLHASPEIEPEHLLLGLLSKDLFLRTELSEETIRSAIEAKTPRRTTSIASNESLPMSLQLKHVLAFAMEEAERRNERRITCLHLALGLLRQPHSFAAELMRGLEPTVIRDRLTTSLE
jgi:ATP-dependent Clp protease ATP-binding subunit ClpA